MNLSVAPSVPVPPVPMTNPVSNNFLLEPWRISIDELGALWGTLEKDATCSIRMSQQGLPTCDTVIRKLSTILNLAPVQIIGEEGLAAARTPDQTDKLFVHVRVEKKNCDVTLKSNSTSLANRIRDIVHRDVVL